MARSTAKLRIVAPGSATSRGGEDDGAGGSTQRIVDAITTAIVERRLMPGTKLSEQKIADIFEVSRTLVRQALHKLAQDGVITLRHNRGAMVPEPTRSPLCQPSSASWVGRIIWVWHWEQPSRM